jgi:hypothetical protein
MPGNREPKTCHLIILQFGLMIHVVPAMMFAVSQPLETRIIHTTCLANDSRVWRREKAIQGITLPHYGNVTLCL